MALRFLTITGRLEDVNRQTERAIRALRRLPYREYLQTHHWRRTRDLALARARFRCALCRQGGALAVHHRSYLRIGFEQPHDLVVLCRECHDRHHETILVAAIYGADRSLVRFPKASLPALTNATQPVLQGV